MHPKAHASHSNATRLYQNVEEEHQGRLDAVTEQMRIIKAQLLKRLNQIPEPRNPKK